MINFIKNTIIIILFFTTVMFIVGGLKTLTCLGEAPGTMVVIGGTSTRCQ